MENINKVKPNLTYFNLQNSPRKYAGLRNRYCYKTNIHNLIYKDGNFYNVKYQASNITECNFKNASLVGVDFVGCNLKKSNFSGAYLKDVIFMNCNLKGVKFINCKFEYVYFIMTDISECIGLPEKAIIMKRYPAVNMDEIMQLALIRLSKIEESIKYHVLHVTRNKTNLWFVQILLDRFGPDGEKALLAFSKKDNLQNLYTLHSYIGFIEKYLHL